MPKKMKDSFILFYQYHPQFQELTDEEAGILIKAIYDYEILGTKLDFQQLPEEGRRLLKSMFINICKGLDINKIKYDEKCIKSKIAADIRWDKESQRDLDAFESMGMQMHTNNADKDKKRDRDCEENEIVMTGKGGVGEKPNKQLKSDNNSSPIIFDTVEFSNFEYDYLKTQYDTNVLGDLIEELKIKKSKEDISGSDFDSIQEIGNQRIV